MIDLHTHSTASDGTLTPTELVKAALQAGITTLALTDHNAANGLREFLSAAKNTPLRAIPGVEITSEMEGEELHILALDLPKASFDKLQTLMREVLARAEVSRRNLIQNLQNAGYAIPDYDTLNALHPDAIINRAHIAAALWHAGYVPSIRDAFDTLLKEGNGYYYPAKRLQAVEAVRMIRELGAIPVWAHSLYELDTDTADRFLSILVPEGLMGMEVYYSTYTAEQTKAAARLCEKYAIHPSGGSDFHGGNKPDIRLGVGRGNLNIPESVAEALFMRKA